MKIADRLPPIPFEGKWRWKIVPFSSDYVQIRLEKKGWIVWHRVTSTLVDPFAEDRSMFSLEYNAQCLLKQGLEKEMLNTFAIVSYKDGSNAR